MLLSVIDKWLPGLSAKNREKFRFARKAICLHLGVEIEK